MNYGRPEIKDVSNNINYKPSTLGIMTARTPCGIIVEVLKRGEDGLVNHGDIFRCRKCGKTHHIVNAALVEIT